MVWASDSDVEKWPFFAETRGIKCGETRGCKLMRRGPQMQGEHAKVAICSSRNSNSSVATEVSLRCLGVTSEPGASGSGVNRLGALNISCMIGSDPCLSRSITFAEVSTTVPLPQHKPHTPLLPRLSLP